MAVAQSGWTLDYIGILRVPFRFRLLVPGVTTSIPPVVGATPYDRHRDEGRLASNGLLQPTRPAASAPPGRSERRCLRRPGTE
jgi:hypothetical protein